MNQTSINPILTVYFRLTMAWTFLYAASHQVFDPKFTVVGFLNTTKTFHNFFSMFMMPAMAPVTTFLVEYGHLLIGLSLLFGLMVRVSSAFGILLMIVYWFAHMNWPFIENTNNSHHRLSPRLCGSARLSDSRQGRPRVRPRCRRREAFLRRRTSQPAMVLHVRSALSAKPLEAVYSSNMLCTAFGDRAHAFANMVAGEAKLILLVWRS